MELNDKLINYLDLSTFQQNILNDASVSEKATWTSLKINSEIEVLVNDISTLQWTCIDDISTLKNDVDASLALKADKSELEDYATLNDVSSYATEEYVNDAIAGVSGNAIEDASVLPDASENKNKLFRLASDDKVYVAEEKVTYQYVNVNKPDSEQIDVAFIDYNDHRYYYKGLATISDEIDTYTAYRWAYNIYPDTCMFTKLSAEQITSSEALFYHNNCGWYMEGSIYVDDCGWNMDKLSDYVENVYIDKIYAPIINWDWEKVATSNDTSAFITLNDTSMYATEEYVDTAIAGVGGDAIEDVSVLPDASANKSKIFRLNSDKQIYMSVFGVANAPDSRQIDRAYIYSVNKNSYLTETFRIYKGETTIHCTDGDFTAYMWCANFDDYNIFEEPDVLDYIYFTTFNANSIIYNNSFIYLDGGNYDITDLEYNGTDWDCEMTVSEVEGIFSNESSDFFSNNNYINGIYLIQTNGYTWKINGEDTATYDDIDKLFNISNTGSSGSSNSPSSNSPIVKKTLIRIPQVQERIDRGYVDLLENSNNETMVWDGHTYYKWRALYGDYNGTDGDIIYDNNNTVLTNTLDIVLPFKSNSPEFEYRIETYDGDAWETEYINGNYMVMELLHQDGTKTYEKYSI